MPQGEFNVEEISNIHIERGTRQRRDVGDISSLADSIRRLGLIHPIVITRDRILVAGERRLRACRQLGWTHIPIQFEDEIDPRLLRCIELEENTKRRDLTWQEINDATVMAYELYREIEPEATDEKIAERMGLDRSNIKAHVLVKKERASNPRINNAATFKTARDNARAANERRAHDSMIHIWGRSPHTHQPILHTDFHEWAPSYSGPKFNLIHCDFPYGIDSQDSGVNPSGYDDSLDIFLQLLRTLATELDRFCAPQAHMIFWFSPKHWSTTQENLKLLDDFTFDDVPLVWHKSDGKGVAPDSSRRPRRVYETAFFGWRGDRKLVRLKDNLFSAPSVSGRHPHEKSKLALRHFFEMVVDSGTAIFDPTCGSGSALWAARALGASRYLGLERDEETANDARRILEQANSGSGV